jgi:xanthine dehydrogenase accessory factor
MSERLHSRLAHHVESEAVVVATVLSTRGATPRKRGTRMLVTATDTEATIGGGELEARVIAAARALLARGDLSTEMPIALDGQPGAAGVCGGAMRIALRRWDGAVDQARARAIASALGAGEVVALDAGDLGATDASATLQPDIRLLIVGGGHCAVALHALAQHLDFDRWVYAREAGDAPLAGFPAATRLTGDPSQLALALETTRAVYAVLLNRDYASDVAALDVLCRQPPAFLGMMGSRRRIAEVRAALPAHVQALESLQAPVGLEIEAQSPHEIAVSILAQLIAYRRRHQD